MLRLKLLKKTDASGSVPVNIHVPVIVLGLNLLPYTVMIHLYDNLINFLVNLRKNTLSSLYFC